MRIIDLFHQKKPVVSFEIFPPKPDYPIEVIYKTLEELKALNPDYISVTYGAGGSSRNRTVEIASKVKNAYGIESLSHLTCVCSSRDNINTILAQLKENNIQNVLALRGDVPKDCSTKEAFTAYQYAMDLIAHIKSETDFCVAAAAYPEGHVECSNPDQDIEFLKLKVDTGADFLITQLFFDNELFYRFREKALKTGINIPMTVGLMPVLNANQIKRFTTLCGASIPTSLAHLLAKYGDSSDLEKAGIEYASEQTRDLLEHNVDGIHFYTMNKPQQIKEIMKCCGLTK